MKILKISLLFVLLFTSIASAAEIHGEIYGPSLNKLDDVVVEIDSTPIQRMAAIEGEYSFTVGPGEYTLSVRREGNVVAEEDITIAEEGSFVIDLFVFPDFSVEDELLQEIEEPALDDELFNGTEDETTRIIVLIILLTILIIFWHFWRGRRKSKKVAVEPQPEEPATKDDLEKVLQIIKDEGGRITQKELRNHFPLSEAKVSLMVSELEAKGKLEKIKKGRGNIIILK